MRNDPNLIKVFDRYGRELFVTKEKWRTVVLPIIIRAQWNKPDQLYGVIFDALNHGFSDEVMDAARQLYQIDSQPVRGASVWGTGLRVAARLDEAENVFRDFIAKHGEVAVILTHLAEVCASRKNDAKVEEILWRSLEVAPNQNGAANWYGRIHGACNGPEAELAALRRIAALPGSWRAQLWLAQDALKSRHLETALAYYQECLSRAGKPVPADLLGQMSGDLGIAGHLPEILQLVEPHFDASTHGIVVGNNLISAHFDLGRLDAAQRILDQLFALKNPDWNEMLRGWDTKIAKANVATATADQKVSMKMTIRTVEGPVWLKPASPAAELFPAKSPDALLISFLVATAEIASNSQRIEPQVPDVAGGMSRAVPLFLAEHVEFNTQARVQTLVPWVVVPAGGFAFSGVPWRDKAAAACSRTGQCQSDYVVATHLKSQAEPWLVELRLIRSIDGKCLETLSASFPSLQPQDGLPELAQQLIRVLARQAEIEPQTPPPLYHLPAAEYFPHYLLRLNKLLGVRFASIKGVIPGFLSGTREVIDGILQLCLALPDNVTVRILLAQTVVSLKQARPEVLPEFKEKLLLLQKDHPLTEPAHAVIQRMLNNAFTV